MNLPEVCDSIGPYGPLFLSYINAADVGLRSKAVQATEHYSKDFVLDSSSLSSLRQ